MKKINNMLKHWILKDGKIKEVPLLVWAKWFQSSPDRIIGSTIVKNVRISTVFLGLDHSFNFSGKPTPPVLFETMIFSTRKYTGKKRKYKVFQELKQKALRDYQVRYCTLKEAQAGHKYAVKFVKKILSIKPNLRSKT